jgi:hypothetical protein
VRAFLAAFITSNPGSVQEVQLSAYGSFTRKFISHPDAELISNSTQRVLDVDGAFLMHKGVDNVMLVMVGHYGNLENNIPVVVICPSENTTRGSTTRAFELAFQIQNGQSSLSVPMYSL